MSKKSHKNVSNRPTIVKTPTALLPPEEPVETSTTDKETKKPEETFEGKKLTKMAENIENTISNCEQEAKQITLELHNAKMDIEKHQKEIERLEAITKVANERLKELAIAQNLAQQMQASLLE